MMIMEMAGRPMNWLIWSSVKYIVAAICGSFESIAAPIRVIVVRIGILVFLSVRWR